MVEFLKFGIDFLDCFHIRNPDLCFIVVLRATLGKIQGTQMGGMPVDDIDYPIDEHIIDTVGIGSDINFKWK